MAENEEVKSLLRMEEENEKALKKKKKKTKIVAFGPITSWQIERGKVEIVTDFGESKFTADVDCSHEVKKLFLLFGRKTMTNLSIILKNRDILLLINVLRVKNMVFPVVMQG